MAYLKKDKELSEITSGNNRREFLKKSIIYGTASGVAGLTFLTGCNEVDKDDISPSEDLMREHGVLNRILLIYDTIRMRLIKGDPFPLEVLKNSALIIRNFIEEYHEKLEENYIFPRFEKANYLTGLVQALYIQHAAGRKITDRIIQFGNMNSLTNKYESMTLIKLLNDFNTMYRPHEAREDTVLFPALRKIISKNEYFSMGEDFEKKEHELFGEDGFETMVDKVAMLEKMLDIYDLSIFTPDV